MNESPYLKRGMLLLEQGRHSLAEKEFRQHLGQEPGDGFVRALLAVCLVRLERRDEAEAEARQAIGEAPDLAYAHYAMAVVMSDRNREDEAAAAITEAIRLEPGDADYHAMRAEIELRRRRWAEALAAAESALQFDPEHVAGNNLRAMALVKLGRKAEAGITMGATLQRNPDDAFSHANQGWTLLERRQSREAMQHFRESLRLDPTSDWAKAGLVEAIKARNPVYSWLLAYFFWMQRLPENIRWGILLGGYFGNRLLGSLARDNPKLEPWISPVQTVYLIFVLLTWLAVPLSNLVLFAHPMGRHALDRDQRRQAILVALCLLPALGSLVAAFTVAPSWMVPAVVFGLLMLPASAIHQCAEGWPRLTMVGVTTLLLLLGLLSVAGEFGGRTVPEDIASGAFTCFLAGSFVSQWLANFLVGRVPRR